MSKSLKMDDIGAYTFYQHVDGGWYCFHMSVPHCDTGEELVIYQHVWPFEKKMMAKPVDDFLKRFTQKSNDEYAAAIDPNRSFRDNSQKLIALQKDQRKKAEKERDTSIADAVDTL